ncbi:metallophosphoesterase [Rhodopseudomonas pseudopalustris]|uniref:metallophosphoesterase family protein n=1 Tax=Rhodopseudomonas pseudopalustris TaxID=1513892 RepID=UPI003F9D7A59
MRAIIDPRQGDVEDDASSTKRYSLLSLAGSLLAEISLPKLALAWTLLIGVPALVLGFAPLATTLWLSTLSSKAATVVYGAGSLVLLGLVVLAGWFGGQRLFPVAERSFWALNALAVQPTYAAIREVLRHFVERTLPASTQANTRAAVRAVTAALAGIVIALPIAWLVAALWPFTRWVTSPADLAAPLALIGAALANSTVAVASYFGAASLVWGIADALTSQPRTIVEFPMPTAGRPRWRIAHLSDIHIVGEPHGFRIESGRAGPKGNDRLNRVFAELEAIHAREPLDFVLVTGDITDAGRSAEWVVFLDLLAAHPEIAQRLLILPGNHDVNVVDRANPARLDLPFSPNKYLRQARVISTLAMVQGDRVRLIDTATGRPGPTLEAALAPHRDTIAAFADNGSLRLGHKVGKLWNTLFPMVRPPDTPGGLGIILLNSNADTHFSFTNALGLVSSEHIRAISQACSAWPDAQWLVGLHHHLVEYPMAAKELSERIGTSLVNGSWVLRCLQHSLPGAVVMHGHRHIDWIGSCGPLSIVSAPSPVMNATNQAAPHFYVHTLEAGPDRLELLTPTRVEIA